MNLFKICALITFYFIARMTLSIGDNRIAAPDGIQTAEVYVAGVD